MSALVALLGAGLALGGGFQRLELISEADGALLLDHAPLVFDRPGLSLALLAAQVEPVWAIGDRGLTLGAGLASQSLQWEGSVAARPLRWMAGIHARALLPVGVQASLGLERGAWTFGAGLALSSAAGWDRPRWTAWAPRPTLLVAWSPGRGRRAPPRAAPVIQEPIP